MNIEPSNGLGATVTRFWRWFGWESYELADRTSLVWVWVSEEYDAVTLVRLIQDLEALGYKRRKR